MLSSVVGIQQTCLSDSCARSVRREQPALSHPVAQSLLLRNLAYNSGVADAAGVAVQAGLGKFLGIFRSFAGA